MYKKSYDYSIFDMLLKDEWPNTQITNYWTDILIMYLYIYTWSISYMFWYLSPTVSTFSWVKLFVVMADGRPSLL